VLPEENPSRLAARRGVRGPVEDSTEQIRQRIRANPDPAKLKNSCGGEVFAIAHHSDDFVDDILAPPGELPEAVAAFLRSTAGTDAGLHLRRSVFVSSAIANMLALDAGQHRAIRTAAIFAQWEQRVGKQTALRQDCVSHFSNEAAEILAEEFMANASFVGKNIGDARVEDILASAAALLRRTAKDVASPEAIGGQIVLGVELISRSCWRYRYWDPNGAHRAIHYFKRHDYPIACENVRKAVMQMLAEAVTAHVTLQNAQLASAVPPQQTETSASGGRPASGSTLEAHRRAEEWGARRFLVELGELREGMLIIEPIVARDGKTVLEANVILNDELVQRLWALAAVRPLRSRVEVTIMPKDASGLQ